MPNSPEIAHAVLEIDQTSLKRDLKQSESTISRSAQNMQKTLNTVSAKTLNSEITRVGDTAQTTKSRIDNLNTSTKSFGTSALQLSNKLGPISSGLRLIDKDAGNLVHTFGLLAVALKEGSDLLGGFRGLGGSGGIGRVGRGVTQGFVPEIIGEGAGEIGGNLLAQGLTTAGGVAAGGVAARNLTKTNAATQIARARAFLSSMSLPASEKRVLLKALEPSLSTARRLGRFVGRAGRHLTPAGTIIGLSGEAAAIGIREFSERNYERGMEDLGRVPFIDRSTMGPPSPGLGLSNPEQLDLMRRRRFLAQGLPTRRPRLPTQFSPSIIAAQEARASQRDFERTSFLDLENRALASQRPIQTSIDFAEITAQRSARQLAGLSTIDRNRQMLAISDVLNGKGDRAGLLNKLNIQESRDFATIARGNITGPAGFSTVGQESEVTRLLKRMLDELMTLNRESGVQ